MDLVADNMMVTRITMVIYLPMQVTVLLEIVEWIDLELLDLRQLQE